LNCPAIFTGMRQYVFIGLWIVATGAWMVAFWAGTERIKRARQSGYRFWAINPLATFYSYQWKTFRVELAAMLVMAACVLTIFALR
jgi:hypothetical protein